MAAFFSKLGMSAPDILDFPAVRRPAPSVLDEIADNVPGAFSFAFFDLGSAG